MNKTEIIKRLFADGHIDFDEACILLEGKETVKEYHTLNPMNPNDWIKPYAPNPHEYPVYPVIVGTNGTCSTSNPDQFVMNGTITPSHGAISSGTANLSSITGNLSYTA